MSRITAKKSTSNDDPQFIAEIMDGKRPKKLDLETFEKLLQVYPSHAGTVIYVYRVDPPIDQAVIGIEGSNIHKLQHPFPADFRQWAKGLHGGGKYELKFNDANLPFGPVATTFVEVPIEEVDPIIDVRTLKRGKPHVEQLVKKWLMEKKIVQDKEGNLLPIGASGAPAELHVHEEDPAQKSAIDLMSHSYRRALDVAIGNNDPLKWFELARSLSSPAQQGGGDSQLIMLVLQQMMQQNTMLMQKVMERENPGGDPMRVMDRMLAMFDRLSERIDKTGKEEGWADTLAKIAPSVATMVGPWFESKAVHNSGLVPDAQLPNGGKPADTPKPASNEPSQEESMRRGVDALAQMILRCMDRSLNGSALATTIVTTQSTEAYYEWRSMGAEGLQKAFEHFSPERWKLMQQRPSEVKEFIEEFLSAFDEEREAAHV